MVDDARLEQRDAGLTPVTEGWFVVNVVDAAWVQNDQLGAACIFEGDAVVGAGAGPCVIFMTGARVGNDLPFPRYIRGKREVNSASEVAD
jgi:hypothetical protein